MMPANSKSISIAAFTGGKNVPSARFRVRQHIEPFRTFGVEVDEFAAPLGVYPPAKKALRAAWAVATLASRVPSIISSYSHDVTLLQREMLSTYATLEFLTKRPRIFDVDDAIWLHKDGSFARRLAKACDIVVCGNTFLAENFEKWNKNVLVIPTAVDCIRYVPMEKNDDLIVGWSGMSGGFKYLYAIEKSLAAILKIHRTAKLRIIAEKMPTFRIIRRDQVDFIKWSPEIEVAAIQSFSVGIMPLDDSLWERGKCSFKMLTYMACGIPVVVSPVGMNVEVLADGLLGIAAKSSDDWVDATSSLLQNASLRCAMGRVGREVVLRKFSVDVVAPQLVGATLSLV